LYHSFVPTSSGGNALSVVAKDETGAILWSDGSETKRNNVLDMYDNGSIQVLVYEYKGKTLVDVNGERLGIFDRVDEWYVDGDEVYIVYADETDGTTTLQTTTQTYGPF